MENFQAKILWDSDSVGGIFSPTEMLSHRNEILELIGLRTERSQKLI